MTDERIEMLGNIGTYISDRNVISFQMGDKVSALRDDFGVNNTGRSIFTPAFTKVDDIQVASRGTDNRSCERIERDIKNNRLLPRLIDKQIRFLYGMGLMPYTESVIDGKLKRVWQEVPEIKAWLESWKANGMEMSYTDFALAAIKRFYYFRDFFVKFRMTNGKAIGRYPIAGMELLENRNCRLGTRKDDVVTETVLYSDFRYVLFGDWQRGAANFKVYPLFRISEIDSYRFAAVSHHRENAVADFYGLNETHEGVKTFLKTSNELPTYIDSFLRNSLAAKVHIVIPDSWITAQRKKITAICNENKKRKTQNETLLKLNNIEVGTEFRESTLIELVNDKMRQVTEYLSGVDNQGKAFVSNSFFDDKSNLSEWKFETIDLKYKEYITSLLEYDKRVDEVLNSAVGLDSSITAVSKPGMMSKSGSDAFYNLIIYLLTLMPDDQKCAEPFNIALQANFPELYKQGIRLGFYREIPSRQQEVSADDRLNEQQV